MAVSLTWSVSVTYPNNTEAKVSVTLKAKSTNGSFNQTSSSYGYIKIDGTKYGNFSHTFKANTTTTLGTKSKTITRTTTAKSISLYAWWHTDVSSGNISKSGTTSVKARPSYTVTFNGNGGATSSRTVYHGYTTTFPSISRTGYNFMGWATSSSASSGTAAGQTTPTITGNTTYYATWAPITYTISYNANGGSNAPSAQVKTHGTALTLTTIKPSRNGYAFKGWSTTSTGNVEFAPGATYTLEGDKTLFAIWENAYFLPTITNLQAVRVASNSISAAEKSNGGYVKISFSWTAAGDAGQYLNSTKYKVELSDNTIVQAETPSQESSGTITKVIAAPLNTTLSAIVTVTDVINSKSVTSNIVLPQGGIVVHIARNEKNITLFGFADENKEGLIINRPVEILGNKLADFVIEQGTASTAVAANVPATWIYRKWNSGIAECFGQVNVASRTYNASGGSYGFNFNYPPNLFISNPICLEINGGITGVVNTDIGFTANNDATSGQTYLINRNGSAVTAAGWVFIHAVGNWK